MKKLISIALTLIVVAGNIGLSLGTHYCGGKAVKTEFTWTLSGLGCGMEQTPSACSSEAAMLSMNCCDNELNSEQFKENYLPTLEGLSFDKLQASALIVVIFSNALFSLNNFSRQVDFYDSPPLPSGQVLTILKQVFRL